MVALPYLVTCPLSSLQSILFIRLVQYEPGTAPLTLRDELRSNPNKKEILFLFIKMKSHDVLKKL